jgi:hypothetical protein
MTAGTLFAVTVILQFCAILPEALITVTLCLPALLGACYNGPFNCLTPKVLQVFFIKIASKQPLFKARWIVQNWGLF